jgi:6-phosphofructokinase
MRRGKLVIAQGGGPTAVINQSLVGAVLEARLFPQIERIYGARYGVRGIANEDFVDLSAETRANLEAIAVTPSSALGSTRDKPDLAYCRNILASLKAHGVSWFLYIGGNDTAETVRIVSEEAAKEGYDLRSIHIPKTIDNDLMESDHAPGFPSAARFVAQAFMGADLDNRSLLGVYVAVVMGRNSGFLTAASAAARTVEGDGPHLIYLPERVFDETKFLSDVKSVHDRLGAASSDCQKESTALTERRFRSSSQRLRRKMRTAMSSSPAARLPTCCAKGSSPRSASSAFVAIHSAISSARSTVAPRTWIAGRRAKSASSP